MPYLLWIFYYFFFAHSGDVRIAGIDGTIVKLELQGACNSCSSSAMTMKMGLEKTLMQRIPQISAVVPVVAEAVPLTKVVVEEVLDEVRPFLSIAGGQISILQLQDNMSPPIISLQMRGTSSALQSVRTEISQRIQKKFRTAIRVDWE